MANNTADQLRVPRSVLIHHEHTSTGRIAGRPCLPCPRPRLLAAACFCGLQNTIQSREVKAIGQSVILAFAPARRKANDKWRPWPSWLGFHRRKRWSGLVGLREVSYPERGGEEAPEKATWRLKHRPGAKRRWWWLVISGPEEADGPMVLVAWTFSIFGKWAT